MQAKYTNTYKENRKKVVFYIDPVVYALAEAYADEIACTIGEFTAAVLTRHITRKEVATRPRGVKEGDIEPIIGAYKEGHYRQSILDKYRITEAQLRTILRVNKVPKRERVTVNKAIKKGLL